MSFNNLSLLPQNKVRDLLANQPLELANDNGEVVAIFDMNLASQICEAYRIAEVQNYIFDTYFDFGYDFEETAQIAHRVVEVMDDEHISEDEACEYVLFQELPRYFTYEEETGIDPTLNVCVSGVSDTSSYIDFIDKDGTVYDEPFHVKNEYGENESLTYEAAIRRFGAKKVDEYITGRDLVNACSESLFVDATLKLENLKCRIDDMHIGSSYTDGIDCEKQCVNVIVEWLNDEGDIWETVRLRGVFVDGDIELLRDDGTSYIDFLELHQKGAAEYIRNADIDGEVAV